MQKKAKTILFFSRGRGRGHAIPDIHLGAAIRRALKNAKVTYASYSTGLEVLKAANEDVVDLGFSDDNPYLPTLIAAKALIESTRPALVIAHEEFAALPAANLAGVPSIFLSAWLPPAYTLAAESLQYACSTIVLEHPGVFKTPPNLISRPLFVGPLRRGLEYTALDRHRARRELSLTRDEIVITAVSGAHAGEAEAPIFELCRAAVDMLTGRKKLIWVCGKDYETVSKKAAGSREILLRRFVPKIEQLYAASDVVITKATRGTTLDATQVGVPTISLSPRLNPIDDLLVPRIPGNTSLFIDALDSVSLAWHIERALELKSKASPRIHSNIDAEQVFVEKVSEVIQSPALATMRLPTP